MLHIKPHTERIRLNLTNHFLIATPDLEDSLFSGSLVYICEHTSDGAMGLIVNKPSPIGMEIVFAGAGCKHIPKKYMSEFVMMGGPVQPERGFVLHTPVGNWQSTLTVNEHNGVTTSRDIIDSLTKDETVQHALLTIGYSSWTGGQLEREIAENSWLTVAADNQILFHTPIAERHQAALNKLGITQTNLMNGIGHA